MYPLKATHGYNVFFGLRLLLLGGLCVTLFVAQERTFTSLASLQDFLLPVGIGIAATIALATSLIIKPMRPFAPFILMIGDWLIVGLFVYVAAGNVLLITGIAATVLVGGMLRLGPIFGVIEAVGVLIATFIGIVTLPQFDIDTLRDSFSAYAPIFLFLILLAIINRAWVMTLDENNSRSRREIDQRLKDQHTEIEDMRERAKAVSEMATSLNATLNFDKILDAALDIGRLSLRHNPKQRVVSLVLLVGDDRRLAIANARGITHIDENETFDGESGIIGDALKEGKPIILSENGEFDAELRQLAAFKNVQSALCIPLRAGYETYGVLVFGSTETDAFKPNQIDTLRAIGTQATVALQNAVLYTTLLEEKEKIIEIEENARKALVRDLHDVPTQTIAAVTMRLSIIPKVLERTPQDLPKEIEEIRQLSQRATDEIRHVMFTLRPLVLETQGLAPALEQLVQKVERTYNQRVLLEMETNATFLLERKQEDMLFYLIEEAVNNARKYAQAKLIRIAVRQEGAYVVVRVSDNGVGFDMRAVDTRYEERGSFGMVNMRERAELIGGEFDLHSAPGQGTRITVRVRVKADGKTPTKPKRDVVEIDDETLQHSQNGNKAPGKKMKKQYSGPLSPST